MSYLAVSSVSADFQMFSSNIYILFTLFSSSLFFCINIKFRCHYLWISGTMQWTLHLKENIFSLAYLLSLNCKYSWDCLQYSFIPLFYHLSFWKSGCKTLTFSYSWLKLKNPVGVFRQCWLSFALRWDVKKQKTGPWVHIGSKSLGKIIRTIRKRIGCNPENMSLSIGLLHVSLDLHLPSLLVALRKKMPLLQWQKWLMDIHGYTRQHNRREKI